jgi:O-acetyl-ADP-ribose deacetylase (regulator of RNase III)
MPRKRGRGKRSSDRKKSPITYIAGDFFDNEQDVKALAFGCHPEGEMNTELTIKLRTKYPDLYAEYLRRCEDNAFKPGEIIAWEARDGMRIYMLGTQKDKYMSMASGKQIERAFRAMREGMEEAEVTKIIMPPVGSGLGALQWHRARRNLERVFKDWKGEILVYMKPIS